MGQDSPSLDPSITASLADINTAEVPVAAVVALIVDVSQHGPDTREGDPAGQQGVRGGSAQQLLLGAETKNKSEYIWLQVQRDFYLVILTRTV